MSFEDALKQTLLVPSMGVLIVQGLGFRDISPILENHMEKEVEYGMDTALM